MERRGKMSESDQNTVGIHNRKRNEMIPFAIGDRACCAWYADIDNANEEFVNELDAEYFAFQAEHYWNLLSNRAEEADKKERQYAAIALRTAYSQALEVFFSLLFASVQAPDCVFGWMSKYTNKDLYTCVDKIRNRRQILTRTSLPIRTWQDFAELIFAPFREKSNREDAVTIVERFGLLWAGFAKDFTDRLFNEEYNCLKHGLRVRMGGFSAGIGPESEPGVPAPLETMTTIARSEFGTTFYSLERIGNTPNYTVKRVSKNWAPENYKRGLLLLADSIANVIAYIKYSTFPDLTNVEYLWHHGDFHRSPWVINTGPTLTLNFVAQPNREQLWTSEQILDSYTANKNEN